MENKPSSPLCEDCGILEVRNSVGGVSILKEDVHTYTQVDTGQESTTAGVCSHVPDPRLGGGGEIAEPWVCTQVGAGPHQNGSSLYDQVKTECKH